MSSVNITNHGLPVNIVHGTQDQLIFFLVLNMWPSHFGLPLLLAIVIFSKRVNRHPTFLNLLIVFIIVGFSSSLLVYAGKTIGPEPSRMVCLFQASLLYGTPVLASTAAFMLVLQMYFTIKAVVFVRKDDNGNHFLRTALMLAAPYVAFFILMLATASVGAANPDDVSRSRRFFYCSVKSRPLTDTITIVASIILFLTILFISLTMMMVYKAYKANNVKALRVRWTTDLSLALRLIGFGLYLIVAMSWSLLSIKSPSSPVPDLVIASAASVVVLIFGSQCDIISVLCFWKRQPPKDIIHRVDLKGALDVENSPQLTQKPISI
jgi:hypothetical protein